MSRARRKKEGLTRLLARPECVARSRPSARPGETRARALFAATCLLVTAGAPPARAADELDLRHPRFERLPGNDELPDKRVTAIAVDGEGFLWLATFGGLVRYDGYSFRRFQSDPADPGTLSDERLRSLLADGEGALWVGTWNAGLNRFDPRTGRATRFRHDPSDPGSLSGDQVRKMLEDRRGRLRIGGIRCVRRRRLRMTGLGKRDEFGRKDEQVFRLHEGFGAASEPGGSADLSGVGDWFTTIEEVPIGLLLVELVPRVGAPS